MASMWWLSVPLSFLGDPISKMSESSGMASGAWEALAAIVVRRASVGSIAVMIPGMDGPLASSLHLQQQSSPRRMAWV